MPKFNLALLKLNLTLLKFNLAFLKFNLASLVGKSKRKSSFFFVLRSLIRTFAPVIVNRIVHLAETESTNRWIAEHCEDEDLVVWADYQTAGRGCGTNRWESERGKNLLFSMLIRPQRVSAAGQFRISMAISLAIVRTLAPLVESLEGGTDGLSIKWPNDIYWHDAKLGGILIENHVAGAHIRQSIIGVGLNVNQTVFLSDAPNPVSLRQLSGAVHDRESLLHHLVEAFSLDIRPSDYQSLLYRRTGFHPYADGGGRFEAELAGVEDDGHLQLRDREGRQRRYAFKEVQFIM